MKAHLFLAAALLATPAAYGRQPASSDAALTNLKSCQEYRRMALIRETDDAERQAELDLRNAFAAYKKLEESCKADASQNEEVSARIGMEAADAATKGSAARSSVARAMSKLSEARTALVGLGMDANCIQEVTQDYQDLDGHRATLASYQVKLARCGAPPGRPTPR